jgi:hypothetical protein
MDRAAGPARHWPPGRSRYKAAAALPERSGAPVTARGRGPKRCCGLRMLMRSPVGSVPRPVCRPVHLRHDRQIAIRFRPVRSRFAGVQHARPPATTMRLRPAPVARTSPGRGCAAGSRHRSRHEGNTSGRPARSHPDSAAGYSSVVHARCMVSCAPVPFRIQREHECVAPRYRGRGGGIPLRANAMKRWQRRSP